METLLQGSYGHLLATPAMQMASLRNSLHLSSSTQHSPWTMRPWVLECDSPLCPEEEVKGILQPHAHILRATDLRCYCVAGGVHS